MNIFTTQGGRRSTSQSPKKENKDSLDVTKYQKDFIAYKYAYQLSKKKNRLLSALDQYTLMPEAQFIKVDLKSKDFCFDKNLKLYLKMMDVRNSFIENYQDFLNPKQITLTSALNQIYNKIIYLYDELTQTFENKYKINSIKQYLEQNNEKTGQQCQMKAEEFRKQMLQQIPIQDQPEHNGYIDSQEFFILCKKFFTTIPIQEQKEILNSFFHFFININQGGKFAAYNIGYRGMAFTNPQNQKTVYINQSQFENSLYIPKFILEQLIEQGIHGLVFLQMINMNITILNSEGQQRMMQKFR